MAGISAAVEKATSDLLSDSDWGLNMDLCDHINRDPEGGKDVAKAIRKRLGHKSRKVQYLTLTLLETCIKNCHEGFHQSVAHKEVLPEVVKICIKRTDMEVRDKALSLLDIWQEAFGGPNGKYPQYWDAFEQVRRKGVFFPPRRPEDRGPLFTPPASRPTQVSPRGGPPPPPGMVMGMPAGGMHPPGPTAAAAESDFISVGEMKTARNSVEVLESMLASLDPQDRKGVGDEIIVELVEQCRTTQRRVLHLVTNCSDETQLRDALALNDELAKVLAKYEALSAGRPIPKADPPGGGGGGPASRAAVGGPALVAGGGSIPRNYADEEDEDEFGQLAHRSVRRSSGASSEGHTRRLSGELNRRLSGEGGGGHNRRLSGGLPPPPGDSPKTPRSRKLAPPPGHRERVVDLLSGELGGALSSPPPALPAPPDANPNPPPANPNPDPPPPPAPDLPAGPTSVRTRVSRSDQQPPPSPKSKNPFEDPGDAPPAGSFGPPPPFSPQGGVGSPYASQVGRHPAAFGVAPPPAYITQAMVAPYPTQASVEGPGGGPQAFGGVEPTFKANPMGSPSYGRAPTFSLPPPQNPYSGGVYNSPVSSPQFQNGPAGGGAFSPQGGGVYSPTGYTPPGGIYSPQGAVFSPGGGVYSPRGYPQPSPLQPAAPYGMQGGYGGQVAGGGYSQQGYDALTKMGQMSLSVGGGSAAQQPQESSRREDLFGDLVQLGRQKETKPSAPGTPMKR